MLVFRSNIVIPNIQLISLALPCSTKSVSNNIKLFLNDYIQFIVSKTPLVKLLNLVLRKNKP